MNLTLSNIKYINPALKFTIKEYLSSDDKILLYEMLIFCSISSQIKMSCSSLDIAAFKQLKLFCKELNISLKSYVSYAYTYIAKYHVKGHRLSISYFLNDKVVKYVGSKLSAFEDTNNLFYSYLLDDILLTEKLIRDNIEPGKTYLNSLIYQFNNKKVSKYFILYKKFTKSAALLTLTLDKNLATFLEILEPFFIHFLNSKCIYTPYNISTWNNSKLEDYKFCPVFFKDRYVARELPESILFNESTKLGTRLHKIFEDLFTKYNKSNKPESIQEIAIKYFKSKPFLTSLTDEIKKDHLNFIQSLFLGSSPFFSQFILPESKILIEHTMKLVASNEITFQGTADLIIINKDIAYLFDYKSSKLDEKYLEENNKKYTKQLSLYSKLLQNEYPEVKKVVPYIIYTRGLIQPVSIIEDIVSQRIEVIKSITSALSSGILFENKQSCFLCRHPNCKLRTRESIWNEDGTKKKKN